MTKLESIYKIFPQESDAIKFLEQEIWNNVPKCPYCNTSFYSPIKNQLRYHCNKCNSNFSVTVRTLFHKSKVDLRKWFYVIEILSLGEHKTIREFGEEINVTKDTAARMIKAIKQTFLTDNDFITTILNKIHNG
ncbi:MAG: hypothetical protein EKK37_12625 [Sphingobacteriales bacterium]|nr:MAG: hypothetical protein EKK37_12625 [Sphingobacteriales bacterium]